MSMFEKVFGNKAKAPSAEEIPDQEGSVETNSEKTNETNGETTKAESKEKKLDAFKLKGKLKEALYNLKDYTKDFDPLSGDYTDENFTEDITDFINTIGSELSKYEEKSFLTSEDSHNTYALLEASIKEIVYNNHVNDACGVADKIEKLQIDFEKLLTSK